VNDTIKLWFLAAIYATCIFTLFTSTSTGNKGMGKMSPTIHRFCKSPRLKAKKCLEGPPGLLAAEDENEDSKKNENNSQCASWMKQATICENSVKKAFQFINMGGCPSQMKDVAACENEWCSDDDDPKACEKECAQVRIVLDQCVMTHVHSFLQQNGLSTDGTVTPKTK